MGKYICDNISKYNFTYIDNDYMTPPELYQKALKRFGVDKFDLDVCCTIENIPALAYCKNGVINGLSVEWKSVNWCNPPFNECKAWIKKAYIENKLFGRKTAMLIPVRTETAYWHDFILYNENVSIEWLRKGYKFINNKNEEMGVFKNALALVYFEGDRHEIHGRNKKTHYKRNNASV